MNAKYHDFKVGSIECSVLLDNASHLGAAGLMRRYPALTEADCRQAYAEMGLSLDEADDSFNILLARLGDDIVLVDTGEGGKPNGGLLPESLGLAGLAPEAVTLVVITHAHGDHVKGLLTDAGEAAFPNARYVISQAEMDAWKGRIADSLSNDGPIVRMVETSGLRLIDMDAQILPGLRAVPIPGHTPGQIALRFESEGETLIHMADLLHSPMQFAHPDWSPRFDADTSLSVPTRREALGQAADAAMLTLFYHLTFPGLGRVQRAGSGFTWEAIPAL